MICESKGPDCQNEATQKVFWPGRPPIRFCDQCAENARHIGDVMGCYIHTEPVEIEE